MLNIVEVLISCWNQTSTVSMGVSCASPVTIALGANNVFDHKGPLQYSAPNSAFAYYGGFDVGRFLYMKYTQRF